MAGQNDNWSSEAYQNAASFVPKLATKVMQWLDPQKDDIILDVGCGDGVLNIDMGKIGAQVYGIDSSPAMITAAKAAAESAGVAERCTFEVFDVTALPTAAHIQIAFFTKAFSNAALHWILRKEDTREAVFRGVRDALVPGGTFTFEMGGFGNVSEIRSALLSAVARRVGLARAREVDPWFFPDEEWVRAVMEDKIGGWKVEKAEQEWRPTPADKSGVEGWVRLMAKQFFEVLPEGEEREACIREVIEVLETVCQKPGGGHVYNYVRLRVVARKL